MTCFKAFSTFFQHSHDFYTISGRAAKNGVSIRNKHIRINQGHPKSLIYFFKTLFLSDSVPIQLEDLFGSCITSKLKSKLFALLRLGTQKNIDLLWFKKKLSTEINCRSQWDVHMWPSFFLEGIWVESSKNFLIYTQIS